MCTKESVIMYHPVSDLEWPIPKEHIDKAYENGWCLNRREDFERLGEEKRVFALEREKEAKAYHQSKQMGLNLEGV